MAASLNIAAIDAGSNGIRLIVAHATPPAELHPLETERSPVRLGHRVFTHRVLDQRTIASAVRAFRHFRRVLDRYHVKKYRAVATSAAREARNREQLLARIFRTSGIQLEVVDGAEEARLVRSAVLAALGEKISPRLIMDLGGGSLDINLLRDGDVEDSVTLPIGTVRLMETLGISGAISEDQEDAIRTYVLSILESRFPQPPELSSAVAVGCGGNAEALALLAPGAPMRGVPTLNFHVLRERMWQILSRNVPERIKAFHVRRDRAEVMGVAVIVFAALARWLNLRAMLVPGVGVREGVLQDLVRAQFGAEPAAEGDEQALVLQASSRRYASHLLCDRQHDEQVRRLALSLFDQLAPVHGLGPDQRLLLELGALLHDVGHFINRVGHNKHGEYLIRNGSVPGLTGRRRDLVACLVRYHTRSEPEPRHKLYASFEPPQRRQIRALSAILRLAEAFDAGHKQAVHAVQVERNRKKVRFQLRLNRAASFSLAGLRRSAEMFEVAFGLKALFRSHV